ncbi:hypothetical protein, partial [Pararobbsia alpina]|uniref:hypothetical protein n=1 Tax=Pararobbsia alpina TaxID=621374 RepID=UPI001C2EEF47
ITAVVLVFEFTRVGQDFLIPVLLAVGGAALGFQGCQRLVPAAWLTLSRQAGVGTRSEAR